MSKHLSLLLLFKILVFSLCSPTLQAQQSAAVKKACRLYQENELERCIAYTSRKLRNRENKVLLELRDLSYQQIGKPEKAIEDYKRALALSPHDTAYQAVGITYYQMEKYPEALHWMREGLKLYPNSVTLSLGLATVTQRASPDWKASLPLYVKTAELDGSGRFYNMAGMVCWNYGDYASAAEYVSKAIAIAPGGLCFS